MAQNVSVFNSRIRNAIGIVLVTVLTSSKVRSIRTKLFIVNWKALLMGLQENFMFQASNALNLRLHLMSREKYTKCINNYIS